MAFVLDRERMDADLIDVPARLALPVSMLFCS